MSNLFDGLVPMVTMWKPTGITREFEVPEQMIVMDNYGPTFAGTHIAAKLFRKLDTDKLYRHGVIERFNGFVYSRVGDELHIVSNNEHIDRIIELH